MHQAHRNNFLEVLAARNAAAIVFSGDHKVRNHDCDYRFRPESDFVYLTGFDEPDSVLLLLPNGEGTAESPRSILFLRERDLAMETWHGRRLGVARATEALGVDAAKPISEFWEHLPRLLQNHEAVICATGTDADRDEKLLAAMHRVRLMARNGVMAPMALEHPRESLHELRLYKNRPELDVMRRAAAVTTEAHIAAMKAAQPGGNECEIDALIDYTFRARGGTGAAYNNIVAGGDNACILHYVENNQELKDGQLLLIDAGCEMDYYATDVTRTFPIGGAFTEDQKALYQIVLDAQLAGIDEVQDGKPYNGFHDAATRVLCQGLIDLGIIEGDLDEALAEKRYVPYTIHKTGHWLGLDVHDMGAYTNEDGTPRTFEPGMVVTVEPGLYFAEDNQDVDPRWRGIGIRIEDDILVTPTGNENLTAGIPKTIEEVEAACAGASTPVLA
ncbi:MAG: aminopeptidase P N-terminal domain-containing protein [Planctomycetota bacterium]|nr:aminopeptidase P N-terminal domain-containing protein [Planctomycetota bacterium]